MDRFIQGMFNSKISIDADVSANTDKLLAESIIHKKVGSYDKLVEVYESAGKYGARDDILNENPMFCDPCKDKPELCATLAAAKEAGSKDYEVYMNALQVAKVYLERMEKQFGIAAKMKIDATEKAVMGNDMIKDAIDKTAAEPITDPSTFAKEACCKR